MFFLCRIMAGSISKVGTSLSKSLSRGEKNNEDRSLSSLLEEKIHDKSETRLNDATRSDSSDSIDMMNCISSCASLKLVYIN